MARRLLCVLLLGCAGGPGVPPASAVRGWIAAVSHDDPHAAYRLLARSLRENLPEAEFAIRWRGLAEERKTQATALGPLTGRPPAEHARGLWSDGRQAELTREPGGWRLAVPRIAPGGAGSPEEAVRRFTEALERHDLDGLIDLLGDPLRGQLERELSDRLTRLKASPHKEIQVDGSKARLRFDERYYLELKLENGKWRVSDFN